MGVGIAVLVQCFCLAFVARWADGQESTDMVDVPYRCSFESATSPFCGMDQSVEAFNVSWATTHDADGMLCPSTAAEGSHYIYVATTEEDAESMIILFSPLLNLTGDAASVSLSFSYYVTGNLSYLAVFEGNSSMDGRSAVHTVTEFDKDDWTAVTNIVLQMPSDADDKMVSIEIMTAGGQNSCLAIDDLTIDVMQMEDNTTDGSTEQATTDSVMSSTSYEATMLTTTQEDGADPTTTEYSVMYRTSTENTYGDVTSDQGLLTTFEMPPTTLLESMPTAMPEMPYETDPVQTTPQTTTTTTTQAPLPNPTTMPPYEVLVNCSFETENICGLLQRTDDDFDWTRQKGDAFGRPGSYLMVVQDSGTHGVGKKAILDAPLSSQPYVACVEYDVIVTGNISGVLSLAPATPTSYYGEIVGSDHYYVSHHLAELRMERAYTFHITIDLFRVDSKFAFVYTTWNEPGAVAIDNYFVTDVACDEKEAATPLPWFCSFDDTSVPHCGMWAVPTLEHFGWAEHYEDMPPVRSCPETGFSGSHYMYLDPPSTAHATTLKLPVFRASGKTVRVSFDYFLAGNMSSSNMWVHSKKVGLHQPIESRINLAGLTQNQWTKFSDVTFTEEPGDMFRVWMEVQSAADTTSCIALDDIVVEEIQTSSVATTTTPAAAAAAAAAMSTSSQKHAEAIDLADPTTDGLPTVAPQDGEAPGELSGTTDSSCSSVEVPCKYGGTCVDLNPGFMCECPTEVTGEFCETQVDDIFLRQSGDNPNDNSQSLGTVKRKSGKKLNKTELALVITFSIAGGLALIVSLVVVVKKMQSSPQDSKSKLTHTAGGEAGAVMYTPPKHAPVADKHTPTHEKNKDIKEEKKQVSRTRVPPLASKHPSKASVRSGPAHVPVVAAVPPAGKEKSPDGHAEKHGHVAKHGKAEDTGSVTQSDKTHMTASEESANVVVTNVIADVMVNAVIVDAINAIQGMSRDEDADSVGETNKNHLEADEDGQHSTKRTISDAHHSRTHTRPEVVGKTDDGHNTTGHPEATVASNTESGHSTAEHHPSAIGITRTISDSHHSKTHAKVEGSGHVILKEDQADDDEEEV